ncbi:patatin-like phospholipase family protein [Rossellomorea vietnamensis]|uniref:Patatin-like phospholipase family protein n=1 Tax=Rossellomorea vietnamensis TaxID=218284 RepID=A0A5D4KH67_9BACI|nr:patatin-like phospholipase family protein [Rossellomorea vietnamensis]TYR76296.1 patatin-like phospholipase family protein [Rossellomorea vietnamensis]
MNIDGVFSGGGIKGLALIGAYKAIEEKGFRFQRVAGTSAGAVIAGFIAAGYNSDSLLNIMDEIDLPDLLDKNPLLSSLPLVRWLKVYWKLGLYKGDALEQWIEEKLRVRGIYTFADLRPGALRVVASDLSNGRLMVLPDDLEKYGIPKETFPVARAIRMSASLPYFFEPVRLKSLDGLSIVVDGGVLSNFPMWLFDKENTKKVRPVLGIKLSHDAQDRPKNEIHNAIDMYGALFQTMKDAHDSRYISRKHSANIIFIPTEGVLTTEFELTEEKKRELAGYGYNQAKEFLRIWSYG